MNDLFVTLHEWVQSQRRLGKAVGISISSMDDPGWLVRIDSACQERLVETRKHSRSPADWTEIQSSVQGITAMGGVLNLNEILFEVLSSLDKEQTLPTTENGVPSYWHSSGVSIPLDLSIRITRWFLIMCDYDWEHLGGIVIETRNGDTWTVEVETESTDVLSDKDLAVLNADIHPSQQPGARQEPHDISYNKRNTLLVGSCSGDYFLPMVTRITEWLEGDWRHILG